MNNEVNFIIPVQRLNDIVFDEGDVFNIADFLASLTGGNQVVYGNQFAGFVQDGCIKVGEDFGEVAAQETAPACQHYRLSGKGRGFVAEGGGNFLDIGFE